MRRIVLIGFDGLLYRSFELLLKNILNDVPEVSQITEESIKKNHEYDFIFLHAHKASPDSQIISLIRELRMNKCLSPIIAFVFSDKNMHRVFSEKAHVLLTYPFMIGNLKNILLNIKQLNPGDIDYIQEQFCDEKYRETLSGAILHAVSHKDWEKVEFKLTEYEKCYGRSECLNDLLTDRIETKSLWDNLLQNSSKENQ